MSSGGGTKGARPVTLLRGVRLGIQLALLALMTAAIAATCMKHADNTGRVCRRTDTAAGFLYSPGSLEPVQRGCPAAAADPLASLPRTGRPGWRLR